MTAEATASAGASLTSQWHAIDWQAARRHVRRLQMRIAKATREQRTGKVKALQYLLTRSFYANYDPADQAYFAQRKQRKVAQAYEPAWLGG